MKRRRASAFQWLIRIPANKSAVRSRSHALLPAPGQAKDVLAEFEAKRENIEDIASRKYDAGERPPIITTRET